MIQYYIVFFPVTVSELTDILSGKFYMPLRASASTDSSDAAFSTFWISKTYITPSVDFFSLPINRSSVRKDAYFIHIIKVPGSAFIYVPVVIDYKLVFFIRIT